MTLSELMSRNEAALQRPVDPKSDLMQAIREFPYRGFIQVDVTGSDPFLMFSNYDDLVAQHFLFKGRDSFESFSLLIWAHFAKQVPVAWDVGAFTGIYSLAAARANPAIKVVAFEPSGNTFMRLVTNVLANDLGERVGTVKAALGSEDGSLSLKHPAGIHCLGSEESLVDGKHASIWFEETVRVMAGDRLAHHYKKNPRDFIVEVDATRVGLVKIDVEGFEAQVLRGMIQQIRETRPVFIIECLGNDEFEAVRSLLAPIGYHHRFVDDAAWELRSERPEFEDKSRNVLFLTDEALFAELAQ